MHFAGPRSSEIGNVRVERKNRESVEISWETPLRDLIVSIYMGRSPVAIDRRSPAAKVRGKINVRISGLDPGTRYYFEVMPQGGPGVITAERLVPLEGPANFRDMGGYATSNGSRVRWGHIYRSDNLANLSEKDRAVLKQMGIGLVCDLRTTPETSKWPDRLPDDGSIDYLQIPIIHGEREFDFYWEKIGRGDVGWLTENFMIAANKRIIDEYGEMLGKIIHILAQPETPPMVFHCAGGRDRTGVCAALILLALGVPEETIIYDYCLSGVFISKRMEVINSRIRARGVDPATVALYYTAPPHFFVPVIEHIKEAYASSAHYLRTEAGISEETLDRLKQKLLE
ncbi:MAG TPA: hypothetical protein ENO25_02925 [Desulfobacteraceae bacterium]|nr:hypothetical protein [Desulfobacteraceae bacterium]